MTRLTPSEISSEEYLEVAFPDYHRIKTSGAGVFDWLLTPIEARPIDRPLHIEAKMGSDRLRLSQIKFAISGIQKTRARLFVLYALDKNSPWVLYTLEMWAQIYQPEIETPSAEEEDGEEEEGSIVHKPRRNDIIRELFGEALDKSFTSDEFYNLLENIFYKAPWNYIRDRLTSAVSLMRQLEVVKIVNDRYIWGGHTPQELRVIQREYKKGKSS